MKIAYITQEECNGVEYHRLLMPMHLTGYDVTRCVGADFSILNYGFDVVLFNRSLPVKAQAALIRDLQDEGTRVIVDIDDYWVMKRDHYLGRHPDNKRYQSRVLEALTLADEVWTTHELLAKKVKPLNKNVHVIPNAIDPTEEQWQPKEYYQQRIGWAGGITHKADLMLTKGAWGDVVPVICGANGDKEWQDIAKQIPCRMVEGKHVGEYAHLYEMFDIAIAPLVDTTFNRHKSNLKIIEAGMKGLPIFVQDVHPYTDTAKGIYKVSDWAQAIREASAMTTEQIQEEGQALREYVLQHYDLREVNKLRMARL
jgi:hypothetical protein